MSPRYRRLRPTRSDDVTAALIAGAVAAGAALLTFYLGRVLLAREPLEETERREVQGADSAAR